MTNGNSVISHAKATDEADHEAAQRRARKGGFVEEAGRIYRMQGDDVQEAVDWFDAEQSVLFDRVKDILSAQDEGASRGRTGFYDSVEALAERVCGSKHWSIGEVFCWFAPEGGAFVVAKQIAPGSCEMMTITNNGFYDVISAHRTGAEAFARMVKTHAGLQTPLTAVAAYPFEQSEIDAQAEEALQAIMQNGYNKTAVVTTTEYEPGKFTLGFRFQDAKVGDVLQNDDHTTSRVLAVVGAPAKALETPLNTFSWRAECGPDAIRFVEACWDAGLYIKSFRFDMLSPPDVVCEVISSADHAALLNVAAEVEDAHVILETLRACDASENSFERDPLVRARLVAKSRMTSFDM